MIFTKFVIRGYRIFFEISLWLNLIIFSVGGGILGSLANDGYGRSSGFHPVLGVFLGLLIGIFLNILYGGFIANLLSLGDSKGSSGIISFSNLGSMLVSLTQRGSILLLISAIVSSIIILISVFSGGFRYGYNFFGLLFLLIIPIIAIVLNFISWIKGINIFSLIAGISFGIAAIFTFIFIIRMGHFYLIYHIAVLLIIPSVLCIIDFVRSR